MFNIKIKSNKHIKTDPTAKQLCFKNKLANRANVPHQ